MAFISQEIYSLLETKIERHKALLYSDPNFLIESYLKNIQMTIKTSTFQKISRQDLFEQYIDKDCLIPIKQIFTYSSSEVSLKQFLTSQQIKQRIYWQIVLRLVKLKINCQKEIKQKVTTLTGEVIKLISTLRMILEQKIVVLKNLVASAFNYVLKDDSPLLFFDKAKYIFEKTELELQHLIEEAKFQIIQKLMKGNSKKVNEKNQEVLQNGQKIKKQYFHYFNQDSLMHDKEKSNDQSKTPATKKEKCEIAPKKYFPKTTKKQNFNVENSKVKQPTSILVSSSVSKTSILSKSICEQDSMKQSSKYIKVSLKRNISRESFKRTLYNVKRQSETFVPQRRASIFRRQSSYIKEQTIQVEQPEKERSKGKCKNTKSGKVKGQGETKTKNLIVIHYQRSQ